MPGIDVTYYDWLRRLEAYLDSVATGGGLGLWTRDAANGELYPTTITDQVGIGTTAPDALCTIDGTLNIWDAGDINVYSDSPGTVLKASIDGATGRINTVQGYQYQAAAPAGHFLRGNGTDYIDDNLAGGVTGKVTHAGTTTTIDSNVVVQDGEPATMWAGMVWCDTS